MKYKKLIIMALGLVMLCSCSGRASKKAQVNAPAPIKKESAAFIQEDITADVIQTSAYNEAFYSVGQNYMITDNAELEQFLLYMNDESLRYALEQSLGENFLEDSTLFITPVQRSSGGYRYSIKKAAIEDDTLVLLWNSEGDEVMTCDMAMYYPYALVPNSLIEGKSCQGWVKPSIHTPVVYKCTTVTAQYTYTDKTDLATIRKTAEKYCSVGSVSINIRNDKRTVTCTFQTQSSNDLVQALAKTGADKITEYSHTVSPYKYESCRFKGGTLAIDNTSIEVYAHISDSNSYPPAAEYIRRQTGGTVTDEYIREDKDDNFYSISADISASDETKIKALAEALINTPYNTDDMDINIMYSLKN